MSSPLPKIAMIAAIAENRVIGKDNALLWDIPKDMQWFRDKTKGKPIIMGRKTYESIGRPLPGRLNIVITRQKEFAAEGVHITHSYEEAVDIGLKHAQENNLEEIFIVGGEQIYKLGLNNADFLYLTHIEEIYEGDAFFPEFNEDNWDIIFAEHHPEEKHAPAFTFKIYAAAGSSPS